MFCCAFLKAHTKKKGGLQGNLGSLREGFGERNSPQYVLLRKTNTVAQIDMKNSTIGAVLKGELLRIEVFKKEELERLEGRILLK